MSIRDGLVAVKASVRMVQLLNDNGYRVSSDINMQIKCFNHEDNEPSARVYPDSDTCFCWVCGKAWDVVAAAQIIKKLAYNDAIQYLVDTYSVNVEASPAILKKFYQQANDYTHGNPIKINEQVIKYGDNFRAFYEKIYGYEHAQDAIDYCWQQYDELYAMALSPKTRARRIVEWYADSVGLIASYTEMCKNLKEIKERAESAGFK